MFLSAVLRAWSHFAAVLWIQHLLWLGAAFVTARLYQVGFRRSPGESAVVFLLTAVLPRGVVYAHSVLSETVFTFLALSGLYLFVRARASGPTNVWGWSGALAGAALLVRPTAWSWAIPMMGLSLWRRTTRVSRYVPFALFTTAFALVVVAMSLLNVPLRGFFGLARLGGAALFGTTAQYLDPSRISDGRVRDALSPIYAMEGSRERLRSPGWVRHDPAGPVETLRRLVPDAAHLDRLVGQLARQAILDRPFAFIGNQTRDIFEALFLGTRRPPGRLSKEHSVADGLMFLEDTVIRYPVITRWLAFQPARGKDYFQRLSTRTAYPYEPGPFPLSVLWPYAWLVGALPTLALLSTLVILREPNLRWSVAVLWTVILLNTAMNTLGGGGGQIRYQIPLEPLFVVLTVAGFGTLIERRVLQSQG